jgi:hypothetical protein
MQWLRKFLICLVATLTITGLFLVSRSHEPNCRGKTFTQWLQIYDEGGTEQASKAEAAEAVRQIGTNALPVLLAWVGEDGECWKDALDRARMKLPQPLKPSPRGTHIRDMKQAAHVALCQTGFFVLGQSASPAIPDLRRFMDDTNNFVSGKAMRALAIMGAEGRRVLVRAVPDARGPRAGSRTVAIAAAIAQCEVPPDPSAFFKLLNDDERLRNYITNAIRQMSPEVFTNAAPE